MSHLHKALETLRPRDFADVPLDALDTFLSDTFSNAELIVNSVPPPPGGTPFEHAKRFRSDVNGATCAADITVSEVRRPPPQGDTAELQKAWGKPLKLGAKDAATGVNVFKMAGHDRHGAWFARTSIHEGLGFSKWKRAMMKEFPESLAVKGGPGEGNVRGIGGDSRLEDTYVEGIGKMEVYQLSAQFPGPTAPREFITLLLTSENCLSDASMVGKTMPRHFMVVSIPVTHPDAPPRDGMVRGQYESVEMIREIPLASRKAVSQSTTDLTKHDQAHSRNRGSTIGFAESRGAEAKGERIDRIHDADDDDPETNPVEWIMITRSDPGGGIPRFMVERGTPGSIVQDTQKFLNWACSKDFTSNENGDPEGENETRKSVESQRTYSIADINGISAGVGTSIADNPRPASFRRPSYNPSTEQPGILQSVGDTIGAYIPDSLNPLQRSDSHSSSTTASSVDSFASAEQFNTAPQGILDDAIPTPSTLSEQSIPISSSNSGGTQSKELQRIEERKQQLKDRLNEARERQHKQTQEASVKSSKELEKATERHNKERKKQEDKFAKEVQKLEARRERETKKLLERQKKEADKSALQKAQRERDEYKERAELAEKETELLKAQIGELQRENTALVARLGRSEGGMDILKKVKEDMEGKSGRTRASSRASIDSGRGSKESLEGTRSPKGSLRRRWSEKPGSGSEHEHSKLAMHEEAS